jgi:hypothetical protein
VVEEIEKKEEKHRDRTLASAGPNPEGVSPVRTLTLGRGRAIRTRPGLVKRPDPMLAVLLGVGTGRR